MLDGRMRRLIDPAVETLSGALVRRGVRADHVTLAGFVLALVAAFLIAFQWYLSALAVMLASRLADALDGAVARLTRPSDFGGFLDIVLDFAFYGIIPLAFILSDPEANALPGAVLLLSFYVNGASFLAYAVMAEKRDLRSQARGEKSIYFTTGLAEATETIAVFALACLFPQSFALLAWSFAAICLYTALSRIIEARSAFGDGK